MTTFSRRLPRLVFVAMMGLVFVALPSSVGATPKVVSQIRTTHTIEVDSMTRSWLEIAPKSPAAATVPIIVVLSGSGASHNQEIARDGLVPYVTSNRAELIYPTPIRESWNASDGCCGVAGALAIDDTGFLVRLVAAVDPGGKRPIDYVGFSNGGRLGYLVACEDPGLFDAMAIVLAVPMPGCDIEEPFNVLQVDGTNDSYIPYRPGQTGHESPPATVEAANLRAVDSCTSTPTRQGKGSLIVDTWSGCANGTTFSFATYVGGQHLWPTGSSKTPSGAALIWDFFNHQRLP